MNIASLEAYGAQPDLLAVWARRYSEGLLPIQSRAVLDGGVLNGASVIGSGPTGCGKTFIGEMAGVHAAGEGRRTFYLAPTKALAEEVYARFADLYGPLGLSVEISTHDRRAGDRRIARGEFDIAVTVPEKLWAMVLSSPALMENVGALIVDELQMLGDAHRGPCLELLLAGFRRAGGTQIVGLSAVLSNADRLADWLGANLVQEQRRPVELRKGVWRDGRFDYHEHNSGDDGEEEIAALAGDDASPLDAMTALAAALASTGEPTLVFLRDRRSCVRAAWAAAGLLDGACADAAVEALRELPRTQVTARLTELLQSGVAFHNADLHLSERRVVEEAFASGEALCLFATTTLALGLNLPAKNVIVEPVKWRATGHGSPSLAPMTQAEFESMAGRAGRLGFGDEFGRAILPAGGGFGAESLTRRYIHAQPEPVKGQLHRLPDMQRIVLAAALDGASEARGRPLDLFSELSVPNAPEEDASSEAAGRAVIASEEALEMARSAGLVARSEVDGGVALTGLGRWAASSGLSVATITSTARVVRDLGRAPTDLEALVLACLAPEAREVPLPRPEAQQHWGRRFEDRARADGGWTDHARGILWSGPQRAVDREAAARIADLVMEWTTWEATAELETRTGIHAGRALALCERVGWLVQGVACLSEELGFDATDIERLRTFGEAIAGALPAECVDLRRMHLSSLQRDHALALVGAGLANSAELAAAPDETLRPLVPPQVIEEIRKLPRRKPAKAEPNQASKDDGPPPALVVDPGRPDIAVVYGNEVPLRPMEFKLLSMLASQPRRCVSFDRIYGRLWDEGEIVEQSQIYYHRCHLAKSLNTGMPKGADDMIRTIPRRGLMLDVPADQVRAA